MRAILVEDLGDPTLPLGQGVMRLADDLPTPILGSKDVLISVVASSVNFPDALQVQGQYQDKPALPFVPGAEVSGVVKAVGHLVQRVKPGDKVCAVRTGGCFADEVVVNQAAVFHVPTSVDLAEASAIPVVYGTADLSLRQRVGLRKGQTLLVFGAAGGVGVAAVQIGRAVGAQVIAVVGSRAKAQFILGQGADVALCLEDVTKAAPLHKMVRQHAPKGVDVVFDPVGGQLLGEGLKSVAWGAHYLVIGFASGDIPKVAANLLLVKNTTMHGVFWGSYMLQQPSVLLRSMQQIMAWFAEGRLCVAVSSRFPPEQAPEAFRAILQRRVMGKVLIVWDEQQQQQQQQPRARL